MKSVLAALISICFLASCSGGLRIEKRQHRDGFYISTREEKTGAKTRPSPDCKRTTQLSTETALTTENAGADTVSSDSILQQRNSQMAELPAEKVDSVRIHANTTIFPAQDSTAHQNTSVPKYNGPSDAKGLVLLQRIALILFLSGIVLFGLGFILAILYWEFLWLTWIGGPLLILVSFGISLAVMMLAIERYRKYVGKDPETAEFYRRMRNRSMIIVGIVSVMLLFLLFLWLVSITGFGI